MSETLTPTVRDGDVYRWRYKDRDYSHGAPNPYWCCSCIAIVSRGKLFDTYWGLFGSDLKSFSIDDERLELSYLGNIGDFERRAGYEKGYYHPSDIMDLRHSNDTSPLYIRKGASRNREAMLEEATRRLDEAQRGVAAAEYKAERARELISKLKAGDDLGSIYL